MREQLQQHIGNTLLSSSIYMKLRSSHIGFFVRVGEGDFVMSGTLGACPINHAFRDYRIRADKFQHTGFCVGGDEGGDMCGGGHRKMLLRMVD